MNMNMSLSMVGLAREMEEEMDGIANLGGLS